MAFRRPRKMQDGQWERVSEVIAARIGLHFPDGRHGELERGLGAAARELGFSDSVECADWLLSPSPTPKQLEILASHLTTGETYFFRDRPALDALATAVLPALISERRETTHRLRLWSAGCCTGEEAYSLAIVLHQLIPDLEDWQVTILGTDINACFLRKAVAGIYGEWSFRGVPARFRERYFDRAPDGRWAIRPPFKRLVTFEHLNLVHPCPSLAIASTAMDVVLCRNVLMYFTDGQRASVIRMLHGALIDGGWLVVSPAETSHALFPQFVTRSFSGAVLYQKGHAERGSSHTGASTRIPPNGISAPGPVAPARPAPADLRLHAPMTFSALVRALANEGKLSEALRWCDRWIAVDRMDAGAHYFRAMILLEDADPDEARRSLQRVLYLAPDLVLAHFALGCIARTRGSDDEADRHLANTLRLLGQLAAKDVLPESDGLTVERLAETVRALIGPRAPATNEREPDQAQ